MSESVFLLERFRAGDEMAATELFDRFSKRLASLVQSRLSRRLARRFDAEDVVMSAYRSFFVRAREGRFTVDESGELWRLLAQITLNKLYRSAEWHNAARRAQDREQNHLAELANQAVDANSSPELDVIVADQLEHLISHLTEATSRVLELRLHGHDADEIAALIGRSPRTVRRQLETIRETFEKLASTESRMAALGRPAAMDEQTQTAEDGHPTARAERRTLDEFVLRRQIGLGLTGRVYEAFDKRREQLVAVKVLRKSWLTDSSLRERFEAEADIVARLNHPGIVRIHGHGATPNRGWFLVMDLLPNGDLTRLAGRNLVVEQAVNWIRQVAIAIGHAHGRGVIHCDLKPANLLLSANERVVVTDFGFAQIHDPSRRRPVGFAGTPAFMAPEQIDATIGTVGPHTDIYGLGAVLFFLLSGSPPNRTGSIDDILDPARTWNESLCVRELRPDVPLELAAVCSRCLRRYPRDRFDGVNEFLAALG